MAGLSRPCPLTVKLRQAGAGEVCGGISDNTLLVEQPRCRETAGKCLHFVADARDYRLILDVSDNLVDPRRDCPHLRLTHRPRGHGRRPQSYSAWTERLARIVGHGVVVTNDTRAVERFCGFLADDSLVRQID